MPEGKYVRSWNDFHLLPGVPGAIARLNRAGILVLVVSNQRGIALGLYTAEDVRDMHAALQSLLKSQGGHVDRFYFCPHDKGQCNCRKPLPGLFEQALADFPSITPETSAMIGDSFTDIEFGHRLGMTTVFVEGDPKHQMPGSERARALATLQRDSLAAAVDALLSTTMPASQIQPGI